MTQGTEVPFSCPVRGHHHSLKLVRALTQEGSGKTGLLVECPDGQYRWLVVGGKLAASLRMKRPRWGWRKDQ